MPKKIDLLENSGVMSDRAFRDLWQQAIDTPDMDAFVAEANCPDKDLLTTQEQLRRLWRVAHDGFRELMEQTHTTQATLSARFCVPYRTVTSWKIGERTCPPYLRLMMAEALGYVRLRNIGRE